MPLFTLYKTYNNLKTKKLGTVKKVGDFTKWLSLKKSIVPKKPRKFKYNLLNASFMFGGVKAACKRCGRQDDSTTFVLDQVYKMMVCRDCVKERKEKENMSKEKEEALKTQPQKPAGWDSDDEYIEKKYIRKKAEEPADIDLFILVFVYCT